MPSETRPRPTSAASRCRASRGTSTAPFRDALDAADTLSFLVVPIRARGGVWGLIGFNDCVTERSWDVAEIEALRAAAGALGAVIEREASIEALRASDERLSQARKMEAIGQLAAGLAHDLRNYLTVIVSYASFLRERVADDGRADADALLETAGRVGDLVDRLLAFGRPQDTVTPELLDVGDVVRGVRDVIRSSLPETSHLVGLGHTRPRSGAPRSRAARARDRQPRPQRARRDAPSRARSRSWRGPTRSVSPSTWRTLASAWTRRRATVCSSRSSRPRPARGRVSVSPSSTGS